MIWATIAKFASGRLYNTEHKMNKNPFRGLGIALVTPFNTDGTIDFPTLDNLVEKQINDGADFICVLGSTSEVPCISPEEAEKIKAAVVKKVNRRIPLLIGISDNCTARLVETVKNANLNGFDGILSAAPSYNKPSQEGIYHHFSALAKASAIPIVLYNIPGRTGVNITAETTLRLAHDFNNIVAIKEASGNITQIEDIMQGKPDGFDLISGDDSITYELIGLGAVGVISVIGNSLTKLFSEMVHLELDGKDAEARDVHRRLNTMYKLMSVDGNPAGIKALLSIEGKVNDILRLPLVPATPQTHEKIKEALAMLRQ